MPDPPVIAADRFDAVLFDLDGVVTRTASVHAAAWKRLFDEFLASHAAQRGEPFRPFEVETDYRQHVDGKPRYDGVRSFLTSRAIRLPEGTPDDPDDAPTICGLGNRKNRYFNEQLEARGAEVFDDTVELINRLRARGIKIAVVSASNNCEAILRRAGLLGLFDARITGIEADALSLPGKPAPDTFLAAAKLLDAPPERAVVFEDAIAGVQAGRAGHFGLVVGVDRGEEADGLRANGADVVSSDLREIAVD